jgi:hypothetical protein
LLWLARLTALLRLILRAVLLWLALLPVLLRLALLAILLRLALLAILLRLALLAVLLRLALLAVLLRLALLAVLLRLAFIESIAAAVTLLRPVELPLVLTVLAGAIAPALIAAARNEAAHGLDHAEVMVGILPVGLGRDPIARGSRLARQRLVLVEDLVGVAAHAHVGTAAVEDLVSIWRAVRIVIVLLLVLIVAAATAASTTAAATRPLPIVWSH